MKIRSLVASAAAVAISAGGLFAAAPAHAAGDTAVTFTLSGGTLSIDVASATKDLGTVSPDSVLSTVAGDLNATTVSDQRNSLAGWTAYAYSTAFARTGGGATDIPAANVNIAIPLANTLSANLRGGALDAGQIGSIFVRSNTTGEMVPLKAVLRIENFTGAEQVDRFNGFIAAKILGSGKPGVSSGQAIEAVQRVAARALPPGYSLAWSGQAFQELRTGNASLFAFGLAIVMVYLILAALYERWRLPSAVVLAVPFAVLGALGLVALRGMENDIYFQIGLVVLIGLAAKNAILIVEFAQQGLLAGMSAKDAAVQAARLRFRPIVMTSLAFVFGVLPLAISHGAGSAARRSMGTGVVGGMLLATFVATIFVPLFFTLFARKQKMGEAEVASREPDVRAQEAD